MILAERLFFDLDRAPKERLSLGILALVLEVKGEIVVIERNVGIILAESLFLDLDRPPIERLGLGVARDPSVCNREVVQCRSSFPGLGAKLGCDNV